MSKRGLKREVPDNCDDKGCEKVSSQPLSTPVKFPKPGNDLEQIVNRLLRQKLGEQPKTADIDDIDTDENETLPATPHEYVYDEDLDREITRLEKSFLDAQRKAFDAMAKAKGELNARKSQVADRTDSQVSSANKVVKRNRRIDKELSEDESTAQSGEA